MTRTIWKWLRPALFYGLLTIAALAAIYPFAWMISTSLKTNFGILQAPPQLIPNPVVFDNYVRVGTVFPVWRFFLNSVFVGATSTALQVVSCAMGAYAFSRLQWRGRESLFLLYLGTMMIPFQVTMVPLFILIKWLGWSDSYLAIIVPSIFSAFGTFLLRQSMLTLPRELEEAAFIDGASHWRVFTRIILPLSKPALSTLGVFSFMGNWNSFLWPLIVINSQKRMTLPLGLANLHGRWSSEWNLVMAGAVISVLPIIVVYLFAQKSFVKGAILSGLKG